MFRSVIRLPAFEKDCKRLKKRFRTLEEDLDIFIRVALIDYHHNKIDNDGIVRVPGFAFEEPKICKARKFACRSLPGKGARSGIRIIYAYVEDEDCIELIEMYYKGDKENEDKKRIERQYG